MSFLVITSGTETLALPLVHWITTASAQPFRELSIIVQETRTRPEMRNCYAISMVYEASQQLSVLWIVPLG
jgi:hypothetical protein